MKPSSSQRTSVPGRPPPLMTIQEAADFLGISERKLFALTVPRGSLAVIRVGHSVRYSIEDLNAFVDEQRYEA